MVLMERAKRDEEERDKPEEAPRRGHRTSYEHEMDNDLYRCARCLKKMPTAARNISGRRIVQAGTQEIVRNEQGEVNVKVFKEGALTYDFDKCCYIEMMTVIGPKPQTEFHCLYLFAMSLLRVPVCNFACGSRSLQALRDYWKHSSFT